MVNCLDSGRLVRHSKWGSIGDWAKNSLQWRNNKCSDATERIATIYRTKWSYTAITEWRPLVLDGTEHLEDSSRTQTFIGSPTTRQTESLRYQQFLLRLQRWRPEQRRNTVSTYYSEISRLWQNVDHTLIPPRHTLPNRQNCSIR